jgi:hypothetical protein
MEISSQMANYENVYGLLKKEYDRIFHFCKKGQQGYNGIDWQTFLEETKEDINGNLLFIPVKENSLSNSLKIFFHLYIFHKYPPTFHGYRLAIIQGNHALLEYFHFLVFYRHDTKPFLYLLQ